MDLMNTDTRERFQRIVACANTIRRELHALADQHKGRVHFRPTDSGITMVGLLPDRPQRGKGGYSAQKLLEQFPAEFDKHCVQVSHDRPTPEKRLQSYLISAAYQNDRRLDILEPPSNDAHPDDGLYFITDELASIDEDGTKVVCDLLALRRSRGRHIPVLIELKSTRAMKELVRQLETYSRFIEAYPLEYEQVYSAVLGEDIKFDDPVVVEKWLVWPSADNGQKESLGPDPRETELANKDIRVVQCVDSFRFHVGRTVQEAKTS